VDETTRRGALGWLAASAAFSVTWRADAMIAPPALASCTDLARVDQLCTPVLALLPEAAMMAGLVDAANGGPAARRCTDWSPDGRATLRLAVAAARGAMGGCTGDGAVDARALLDAANLTADVGYGWNDPLAGLHRPYLVTAFAGPHLSTPLAMRLIQPLDGPPAIEAWLAKLDGYGDALLGLARTLRTDADAGCLPPVDTGRAALAQMDAFLQQPAETHALVRALGARLNEIGMAGGGIDPAARDAAVGRAATLLRQRVQPNMALARDTLATVTRRGRQEIGLWAQTQGDRLHAANLARAGDTTLAPDAAQQLAQEAAQRIAAVLDRRLAARGLRKGTLAERVAAAFAAHPEFVESDDEGGRASLLQAAQARIDSARAVTGHWLSGPAAAPQPLALRPIPDGGRGTPAGSFYQPMAIDGARPATLWLDTRSVYALPLPGVSPIAFRLGLPGLHLQDSTARIASVARPLLARIAAWPAYREGWAGHAERLAVDAGLFARDPWGDIARLSDELLRAARLVVDVGIHGQRWTREQAEARMTELTGAPQSGAIDRIVAEPGEAASATLGLERLTDIQSAARQTAGKRFDPHAFHAAVLDGGPRPFAAVEKAVMG
jgi:uncharacterized protein (DUF885 family)